MNKSFTMIILLLFLTCAVLHVCVTPLTSDSPFIYHWNQCDFVFFPWELQLLLIYNLCFILLSDNKIFLFKLIFFFQLLPLWNCTIFWEWPNERLPPALKRIRRPCNIHNSSPRTNALLRLLFPPTYISNHVLNVLVDAQSAIRFNIR
jgi:hypothetical protein